MPTLHRLFSVLVIFFSCASTTYEPKFYSRVDLTLEQLPKLYKNVPFFQDSTINLFIIQLAEPELPKQEQEQGIVGTVLCHPLIDESGKLEAVYVKIPLTPGADLAAIDVIKKSHFRTYKEVTHQRSKYSLIIPVHFYTVYEKGLEKFFKKNDEK
jgi:hypothetical protein